MTTRDAGCERGCANKSGARAKSATRHAVAVMAYCYVPLSGAHVLESYNP